MAVTRYGRGTLRQARGRDSRGHQVGDFQLHGGNLSSALPQRRFTYAQMAFVARQEGLDAEGIRARFGAFSLAGFRSQVQADQTWFEWSAAGAADEETRARLLGYAAGCEALLARLKGAR